MNAYLLAYIVAMPLAGRAADLWGARRLYVVALVLFALGSAGAGMSRLAGPATGLDWLIAARVVQGLGGGALVPLSMALASHLFSGRTRAAALGIEGAATFVGMAIGPSYGAWVLQNVSLPVPGLDLVNWQWIFILNVPAAIITLFLIYVIAGGVETPRAQGGIDVVGSAARLGRARRRRRRRHPLRRPWLDRSARPGRASGCSSWPAPPSCGSSCGGAHPLVNPRLFADRGFSASNAVSLLTGYTLATAIIGGPVFVSRVLFGTDGQAAAALTALTAAIAVGAVAGGAITALVGERLDDRPRRRCSASAGSSSPSAGGPAPTWRGWRATSPSTGRASGSPSARARPRPWRRPAHRPMGWRARCSRSPGRWA